MNAPSDSRWHALVMAAGRGPDDPMARAYGVSHKCLLPVAGTPMLRRVMETLNAHPAIAGITISIEDPAICRTALDGTGIAYDTVSSRNSAPASLAAAIETGAAPLPLLVTTADHPLLSPAMLDHFLNRTEHEGADLTVGLASAEIILAAYPDAKRTFLKFGRDRVSGCNLFALTGERALNAVRFWQDMEKNRKKPWKLIGAFGPGALVRYATGRIDLDTAFAIASRRLGLVARPVLMPFADAAVDVDKPVDLELVERILSSPSH